MTANVPNYIDQGGAASHIGGTLTIESGGVLNIAAGAVSQVGGVANDRPLRSALVALSAAADTAGAIAAWANPTGATIFIHRIMLNLTTIATGACTVSAGVAANATTLSANLLDGLDVHSATGLFDNFVDHGTLGKFKQLMTSGQVLTVSTASGNIAGAVGNLYVWYSTI